MATMEVMKVRGLGVCEGPLRGPSHDKFFGNGFLRNFLDGYARQPPTLPETAMAHIKYEVVRGA